VTEPALGTGYLSLEDLLDLVNALGAGPVRDVGLLDSACHRPQASLLGHGAYPTLAGKAAALMHSLAGNHALVDGNKRLALLATAVFLRINGYILDLTDDAAFDLTMSVAAGELDAEGICTRLRLVAAPDCLTGREPGAGHGLLRA
jgi:death on curing protein